MAYPFKYMDAWYACTYVLIHDTHAANVWPAGRADSFEEFMAKKQRKEREEQARKAGVTVGGGDGDDDDDVCGSVEECEAIAGSGSSAPKPSTRPRPCSQVCPSLPPLAPSPT